MSVSDNPLDLRGPSHGSRSPGPGARFLIAGEFLTAGEQLDAPSSLFLALMRGDGEFVVYRSDDWSQVWSAGTAGHPEARLAMQDDGDAVICSPDGETLWRSSTSANPGAFLELCDDGELIVRDFYRTPVWSNRLTTASSRPRPWDE